jgi:hypothetical protein
LDAGRSAHPRHQTAPHAHSINLDAANRFAFAADPGLDKVLVYRFDAARGRWRQDDAGGLRGVRSRTSGAASGRLARLRGARLLAPSRRAIVTGT